VEHLHRIVIIFYICFDNPHLKLLAILRGAQYSDAIVIYATYHIVVTYRIEPNRTWIEPDQTESNRTETDPNRTEPNIIVQDRTVPNHTTHCDHRILTSAGQANSTDRTMLLRNSSFYPAVGTKFVVTFILSNQIHQYTHLL